MPILVVGHPVLDEYAHWDTKSIRDAGLVLSETVRFSGTELSALAATFPGRRKIPGGSGPNTASALVSANETVKMVGIVANDEQGKFLADRYAACGIELLNPPVVANARTTRCLILVSESGESATAITIGATELLSAGHLPRSIARDTSWTFFEGRVIDQLKPDMVIDLARRTRESGGKVAFSLSGRREVQRHRSVLLDAVLRECDVVFGSQAEYGDLGYQNGVLQSTDGQAIVRPLLVITRGDYGSALSDNGEVTEFPADPVPMVVDSTGAGDAFAAGFLIGANKGLDNFGCMRSGSAMAALAVGRLGSWMGAANPTRWYPGA